MQEWRWVAYHKEDREIRKRVRAYCVPDSKTWGEIMSRYYYDEEDEDAPQIPEVLESREYCP